MKFLKKTLLSSTLLLTLFALTAAAQTSYTVMPTGAKEVPPVNSNGSGVINVKVQGDSLQVTGTFSQLSSRYTGAHIHMGGPKENGNVIFPLKADVNEDGTKGEFKAMNNTFNISEEQLKTLKSGMYYVNIHSDKHPKGEIRAQIK